VKVWAGIAHVKCHEGKVEQAELAVAGGEEHSPRPGRLTHLERVAD
jgi:hypothetical protein